MKKEKTIWEGLGYLTLLLCIIGQTVVSWSFFIAQFSYLFANFINVIRGIVLKLPTSILIKDIVFTGITIALIIIKVNNLIFDFFI